MKFALGYFFTISLLVSIQVVVATIPASVYYQGLQQDASDNSTIWTGGPDYLHDLFYQLSFAFPTEQGSRRPIYIDDETIQNVDSNRPMKPSVCRLTDFLKECYHQFEGLDGVEGGNDNERPFVIDFAVTDKPIPEEKYDLYPDLQYYPALGLNVVPIHSVAGFDVNGGDPLILTRVALSKIFRGNITIWGHPEILATNPNHIADLTAAGEIKLVVRANTNVLTDIFKSALCGFETAFLNQVGNSSEAVWNGVPNDRLYFKESGTGSIAFLRFQPNAIGYVTLAQAIQANVEYAALLPRTYTSLKQAVIPDSVSTEFVISDKGLDYGNDGSNPIRLTADLINPRSNHAWPIATYIYFSVRHNTLRLGADCSTRQSVFNFIDWFYQDDAAHSILRKLGYSPLPTHMAEPMLGAFRSNFMCNGKVVYSSIYQKSLVDVYGIDELLSTFDVMKESYERYQESVIVNILVNDARIIQNVGITEVTDAVPYIAFVKKSDSLLMRAIASNKNLQLYPYAGVGMGIVYNLCGSGIIANCTYDSIELQLDLETVEKIFDGEIKYWDDTKIMQQNPAISLPHLKIQVVKAKKSAYYSFFDQFVRSIASTFNFSGATIEFDDDESAITKVYDTAGSITFYPLHGSLKTLGKTALIKNKYGNYVAPTPANIQACAKDTFNVNTGLFDLVSSQDPNCYPISEELYIISPINYASCTDKVSATTSFLRWLIGGYGDDVHAHDIVHYPPRAINVVATALDVKLGLVNNLMAPLFSAYVNPMDSRYRKDGNSGKLQVIEGLESITCEGDQMMLKHANLQLIPDELITAMYAIASLALAIIFALGVWTFVNRKKKLVRNSSPVFMYQILFGAAVSILAIYPMGIQDSFYSFHDPEVNKQTHGLDMACQAMPFLYSVGFALSFSSLFVKTWRMVKLFNNRRFKKLRITDWMLVKYQIALVLFVIIYNIGWIALDPLRWKRIGLTKNDSGRYITSTGICVMNHDVYVALGPLMGFMILLLAVGNYLSYQARNIPSEFSESKWISFSMILYLEALVLGVPVVILSAGNASSSFIVKSVAILLADFGTVLLIFIPKIWLLYGWGIDGQSSLNKEGSASDSSSKASSKKQNGSKNSRTNSRENVNSTHPAGAVVSGLSTIDAKIVTANINSQGSLTDITGSPYGVSMKASASMHDIKIKSQKSKSGTDADIPVEINSKVYSSISEALEDESVRQSLIAYAAPQLFDEPVRFYSDVMDFKTTKNPQIRSKKAISIIKRYILADSPLELCLPAPLRHKYERMLAIQEQENGNEKESKSRGIFSFFSSSPVTATTPSVSATVPIRIDVDKKRKSKDEHTPAEQLSDVEVFQPVMRLVSYGIQGDRKRWRGAITFLDAQATTMKRVGSKEDVSLSVQVEQANVGAGSSSSTPKENPSHLSLS